MQGVFKVGKSIVEIFNLFPNGKLDMSCLPVTDKLIKELEIESKKRMPLIRVELEQEAQVRNEKKDFQPLSYPQLLSNVRAKLPNNVVNDIETEIDTRVTRVTITNTDRKRQRATQILNKARAKDILDRELTRQ